MGKIKSILFSILFAIILIIFPVLSGVLIGVLTSINGNNYDIWGKFIQSGFFLISIIIAFLYLKRNKIKLPSIGITFKLEKIYLLFLPCLLIFIPTLCGGLQWKGMTYFFGCLFLYSLVGISEEIYFRGIIPNILNKEFNIQSIILISTLIFGLGHASIAFASSDIFEILLTIINALIFGWLAIELKYLTQNITFLMLIHFLFDFESKFILMNGTPLIIAEFLRGTIMAIYAIVLLIIISKNFKHNIKDN